MLTTRSTPYQNCVNTFVFHVCYPVMSRAVTILESNIAQPFSPLEDASQQTNVMSFRVRCNNPYCYAVTGVLP